jgi:hypothetical protein
MSVQILKNSSPDPIHVFDARSFGGEIVAGRWQRVHEYLEEIEVARRGVKAIMPGTGRSFLSDAEAVLKRTKARYGDLPILNTNFSFVQTVQSIDADGASLTNSVTETALATSVSFLGSGSGTGTGGFFQPQKTLRMWMTGVLSSAASAPGNFNLNIRQDSTSGTSAGAQTAYALAVSLATSPIECEAFLVCRADGTAGNVEALTRYFVGLTPSATTLPNGQTTSALARANIGSFDTTGNRSFLVTGLFSAASTSNIAIAKIFIVEVLN